MTLVGLLEQLQADAVRVKKEAKRRPRGEGLDRPTRYMDEMVGHGIFAGRHMPRLYEETTDL